MPSPLLRQCSSRWLQAIGSLVADDKNPNDSDIEKTKILTTQNMKTKSKILILIGLIVSSTSFGQKEFNKNYKIDKDTIKVSLIPIINERNSFNDTIMTKIFDNQLKNLQLITPFKTREIIMSDFRIQKIIDRIVSIDYKKNEVKTFPNLNTIIEKPDVDYLKERINGADLVLIPIVLNFKSMASHTFGYIKFRMYDLNTGDFVFEFSDDMNVNISGENAMKGLTGVLISVVYEYYSKNFLKRNKIE